MIWPKVTVLMSVKSGSIYLEEAIDSIVKQTYKDFIFLIYDDGCTRCEKEVIKSYKDSRIKVITNNASLGLTKNLNHGIKLSKSKYIVRMDADDISSVDRIQKQVDYMEKYPWVDVCGSWVKTFGEKEEVWQFPLSDETIKMELLFSNSIAHPAVIIRAASLKKNNLLYNDKFTYVQDYELWNRSKTFLTFSNIPEILLHYRLREEHYDEIKQKPKHIFFKEIHRNQLLELGFPVTDDKALNKHLKLIDKNMTLGNFEILRWVFKLYRANMAANIYNRERFAVFLLKKVIAKSILR